MQQHLCMLDGRTRPELTLGVAPKRAQPLSINTATSDACCHPTTFCLTVQTFSLRLVAMVKEQIRRLLDAYPAIYLACHRRHVRSDETGRYLSEHQASVLDHLDAERPMTL